MLCVQVRWACLDHQVQMVHQVLEDLEDRREPLVPPVQVVLRGAQDGPAQVESRDSWVRRVELDSQVLLAHWVSQASRAQQDHWDNQVSQTLSLIHILSANFISVIH